MSGKNHSESLSESLSELRRARCPDGSFDNRDFALSLLRAKDPYLEAKGYPRKVRSAPCHDCAVYPRNMYTPIAAAGYRHLYADERREAAARWTCHNGGRCEGAAIVLGAEDSPEGPAQQAN